MVVATATGRPIEGAYILLENQPLASSTGGRIIIPWKTNSKDTVLVQSLGYKSQYIYLSEAFKKVNIQTVYLYPEIKILEEVIITGECSGAVSYTHLDDIVRSRYPTAPSIRVMTLKIDNQDDEMFAKLKYQKAIWRLSLIHI